MVDHVMYQRGCEGTSPRSLLHLRSRRTGETPPYIRCVDSDTENQETFRRWEPLRYDDDDDDDDDDVAAAR